MPSGRHTRDSLWPARLERILHGVRNCLGERTVSERWPRPAKRPQWPASRCRRGICHDNAVVESFFNLLKCERITRRTRRTRNQARPRPQALAH
ncbi:hypothetical protein C4375_10450 [Devosia sp. I507]|nr:hypothetical protein C4375_10450 [Devosia sp. I507]